MILPAVLAVVLGGGVGFGLWLAVRALQRKPRPLADALADLSRPRPSIAERSVPGPARAARGRGGRFAGLVDAATTNAVVEKLRILGKTPEKHTTEKLFAALAGVAAPAIIWGGLTAGGVSLPAAPLGLIAVIGAVAGFFYPDLPLGEQVAERQQEFRRALSAYLDLVSVALAGGSGLEEALVASAQVGDGWAFAELRQALRRAHTTGRTPWEMFDQLGEQLDITELRELANSAHLAGDRGARIRASLIAKAEAVRVRIAAAAEEEASKTSERMTLPVVAFVAGIMMFVAFAAVMTDTSTTAVTTNQSSSEASP